MCNCVCRIFMFILLIAGTAWSDSLVAHWALDEGAGSYAYDSSANSNTGTLYNMDSSDWVAGLGSGTVLDFDGSDDYVLVNDHSSINFGAESFTVAFWMKSPAGVGGEIIHKGTSVAGTYSGKRYTVALSGGAIYFTIDDNATKQVISAGVPALVGEWHHVTCYRDMTVGKLYIYIDGEYAVVAGSAHYGNIASTGEPLFIGRRGPDETPNSFPGQLDDIRIYDYVLSEAQIEALGSDGNFPYAWNPSPVNGTRVDPAVAVTLSWSAGLGAASHDVYFGTSESAVTNAARLAGDVNGSGPVDIDDIMVMANQWLGSPVEPYADLDDDGDVDLADFAGVSADWLDVGSSVFMGNQTATSYSAGILPVDQTYYWRVDEVSGGDTYTGPVWRFTVAEASSVVKIMPLGDSITQGGSNYRYYLWHKLQNNGYTDINFVGSHDLLRMPPWIDPLVFDKDHEGHSGWTTDQIQYGGGNPDGGTGNLTIWLNGLQATDEVPDIVLMHLGTNDIRSYQGASGIINEMKSVINVFRSYNPNVTILLAKIIPHQDYSVPSVDSLNALIPSLDSYETATSEVIIVDHHTGFSTSWLEDYFHPNPTGSIEMSNRWYAALTPLL